MVCPSSGEISLLGIAREKQNDDYTNTTTLVGQNGNSPGTISLESASTSGNNHGPQVVMEATNTSSPSYPDGSAPYAMSEFYSYDHDAVALVGKPVYSTSVPKEYLLVEQQLIQLGISQILHQRLMIKYIQLAMEHLLQVLVNMVT